MPEALIRKPSEEDLSEGTTVHLVSETWRGHLPYCSADLCKHTSGCSVNKSRLYCPLTSAELLIVNVTQLQRRCMYGELGWLTAANAPHVAKIRNTQPHRHSFHPGNIKEHGSSCLLVELFSLGSVCKEF
ncbi:hypothetical protein CRENBAI_020824 [Crenichthys baileyi]|uniref:Uncharacterized protein n=1 Tax=Crenichthys baileyi TaxID=28760 RepID=A0AAV9SAS0_9TELE